ncbi:MAG: GntR family transcriptional regulator [Gammaproteobacteria bacterium]|nr:GntR family transcriptional regulator [Gammaproteobacteria bacterium]
MSSPTDARSRDASVPVVPHRRHKLVALHHQIYLTLRNELIRGHYGGANGRTPAPLPAEHELASQFEVSRVTVRRIARDARGGAVEYFEALTRPDLFSYSFRFGANSR